MKRRNFLLLTTAGAIATMTPFCKTRRATLTALNTPNFLAAICDIQTIHKIGTNYRATTPTEAQEGVLTELLTTGGGQTEQLIKKVNDDFAAGRTVTIDGWVLSVTEARQCALNSIQLP
jgi:hypothetical protein